MDKNKQLNLSSANQLDNFIEQIKNAPVPVSHTGRGRILFALDATASRERSWDHASHIQNEMFVAADKLGGLQLKLCYFRGFNDFYASDWLSDSSHLQTIMGKVHCMAGHTQIGKILHQALQDTRKHKVDAVILIGDCCEESIDHLCALAGELGLLSTPIFVFQEGNELTSKRTFKEIARLSGGAYHSFDSYSAHLLKQLLTAVAIYATGGKKALEQQTQVDNAVTRQLLQQLK